MPPRETPARPPRRVAARLLLALTLACAALPTESAHAQSATDSAMAESLFNEALTLLANQNFSDGITIVSGSHVVDFGGTIQTISNAIHGISLNSKGLGRLVISI